MEQTLLQIKYNFVHLLRIFFSLLIQNQTLKKTKKLTPFLHAHRNSINNIAFKNENVQLNFHKKNGYFHLNKFSLLSWRMVSANILSKGRCNLYFTIRFSSVPSALQSVSKYFVMDVKKVS